jgi:hypothetical protein
MPPTAARQPNRVPVTRYASLQTPLPEPNSNGAVQPRPKASREGGNTKRGDGSVRRIILTALANPDIAVWSNVEVARILGVSASSVDRCRSEQPDMRPKLPAHGLLRLCRRGNVIFKMNVGIIGSSSHG